MDRPLGAIENAALSDIPGITSIMEYFNLGEGTAYWKDCLFYQWGRKDPLNPDFSQYKAEELTTYDASTQNPLWFDKKWNPAADAIKDNAGVIENFDVYAKLFY
jgi:hypothetical protein